MTDQNPPTPPGWYHAPGDPEGTHRYWDGELWQGTPVAPAGAQQAYGGQPRRTNNAYAGWGTRVGASLLDLLIFGGALLVVFVLAVALGNVSPELGLLVGLVLGLPTFAVSLYLLLWVPGITGQSPGRRIMGYEIVSERDGTYIGGGAFIGREIIGNLINNLCYIDYLWPLWDEKNQRLADKVVSSVAVLKNGGQSGKLFPIFPSGKPF